MKLQRCSLIVGLAVMALFASSNAYLFAQDDPWAESERVDQPLAVDPAIVAATYMGSYSADAIRDELERRNEEILAQEELAYGSRPAVEAGVAEGLAGEAEKAMTSTFLLGFEIFASSDAIAGGIRQWSDNPGQVTGAALGAAAGNTRRKLFSGYTPLAIEATSDIALFAITLNHFASGMRAMQRSAQNMRACFDRPTVNPCAQSFELALSRNQLASQLRGRLGQLALAGPMESLPGQSHSITHLFAQSSGHNSGFGRGGYRARYFERTPEPEPGPVGQFMDGVEGTIARLYDITWLRRTVKATYMIGFWGTAIYLANSYESDEVLAAPPQAEQHEEDNARNLSSSRVLGHDPYTFPVVSEPAMMVASANGETENKVELTRGAIIHVTTESFVRDASVEKPVVIAWPKMRVVEIGKGAGEQYFLHLSTELEEGAAGPFEKSHVVVHEQDGKTTEAVLDSPNVILPISSFASVTLVSP